MIFYHKSKESSASTHICIFPSRYSLAYSSGSSIAKAFKAHSEHGVVFNPSSALLQSIRKNGQFYNHYGYDEQSRSAAATAGGFASFEEAEAALRSHRPNAEKVMEEVHAEPVPDTGAGQMPEDETPEDAREDAVPTLPETAEDGAKEPAYQVGDTVYLEDTPYIVEEIGLFDVQLRDPALAYPVLRAESKERLERMLWADERNAHLFVPEVSAEQDDPHGNSEYFRYFYDYETGQVEAFMAEHPDYHRIGGGK